MESLNNLKVQLRDAKEELEKIKSDLLSIYAKYNGNNISYTDEELLKAAIQIRKFVDKLSNMVVYENNIPRRLNNLELFVAMYDFVADRIYVDQDTSHDIIGTLITNKGVCQGYCQLMSFLCESFNIPYLYKRTETFDENNNPLGSHGNFEVIVQGNNGFSHCLHCDPTIDSPKSETDTLGFNSLLIQDNDINRYYHKQIPSGNSISSFYNNFLSKQNFEQSISLLTRITPIEQIISEKTDEEIINGHYVILKNNLVELNRFFKLNINFNNLDNSQLIDVYRAMYKYYNSIATPFDPEELTQAIKSVKAAEIMYEQHINFDDALVQSEKIFEQRMAKSMEQHEKYWDKDGCISLMYMESKKENGPTIK